MNTVVLIAVVLMAVLGLALGVVIGWFAKLFRVETDSRVELVTELLPGANCGGLLRFRQIGGRGRKSAVQVSGVLFRADFRDRDGARHRRRRILPAAGGGLLRRRHGADQAAAEL